MSVPFSLLTRLADEPVMDEIWSETSTVQNWLRVEGALAEAQGALGVIPAEAARQIADGTALVAIDYERLWRESVNVGYPILPLVNQLVESLPPSARGWVHYGATTQDIMDSGLALQLQRSCARIVNLVVQWGDALAELSEEHALTVMPGRTHAQQAVPTTFGAKLAVFLDQLWRERVGIESVADEVGVVSLFGAGGTSAATGRERAAAVRSTVATELGLADARVPWHVGRGGPTRYGQALSTTAAVAARFAREIIDLSRTEVGEVREQAGPLRGASSTMPQKANPISSEQIIGLAISASASASALLRAMEAGHERAAGEWQIEWQVLPTVSGLVARAVALCIETTVHLSVDAGRMRANLSADGGLIMSEAVMMRLAPVQGRDHAHEVMYEAAVSVRESGENLTDEIAGRFTAEDARLRAVPRPEEYVGEAADVVRAAIHQWRRNDRRTADVG